MNEHLPYWKRFTGLTPEAALSLLRKKLPEFKCIACGRSEIALLGTPSENQHTRLNVYAYPHPAAEGHIPTLAFSCKNCGYVHSFDRSVLDPDIELNLDGQTP